MTTPVDRHRPAFHFTSPAGWLNDPNGLTQWDGRFHLFYQYNPHAPVHHRIHWGHAVSDDLVNWEDLPIALEPGDGPDRDGCWSGALVDDDGVPTLVYSGRRDGRELPCIATGSPDLETWTKDPGNPVIPAPPAGLDVVAFRDHRVWREGGRWRQVIGSGVRGVGGTALLYESEDLRSWTYLGQLLTGDGATSRTEGPFWTGTMWECVDLFRLEHELRGEVDFLVFSAWDDGTTHHPLYFTGVLQDTTFAPERLHRLDFGGRFFYAPQSMSDDLGRRVVFGWMQEGRAEPAVLAAGWSGVMSLPRVVTARQDGSLHQEPVPEVADLRTTLLFDGDAADLVPGSIRGNQLDLELAIHLPEGAAVGVVVLGSEDGTEHTRYELARTGGEVRFSLDRRHSSLDEEVDCSPLAGTFPAGGDGHLVLRIIVDHSAIEAFADGHPLAARVYPTRPDACRVTVELHGAAATLRAWAMGPAAHTKDRGLAPMRMAGMQRS